MSSNLVHNNLYKFLFMLVLSLLSFIAADAKNTDDIVIMKNGDRMTGEIKNLQRGELEFKSDYMESAVRLDWARVESLESKSTFLIFLADGNRFTNVLRMLPTNSNDVPNFVIGTPPAAVKVRQLNVIRIIQSESKFLTQLEGAINLGFSFTSGNDQYQTDLSANATYRSGLNSYSVYGESSLSGQTEGTSQKRYQFTFDYRRQLTNRYYAGALLDLLKSDQQSLSLRTAGGGLIGRNFKQTEHTRFSVFAGGVLTREKYSAIVGRPKTVNFEALTGFDFETFRFSKTDLRTRFSLFPSVTTPGRTRMQLTSDLSYKLVKDLWLGFHVYENFDSKPPVRADKNDLGISTSIGWKF